MYVLEAARGRYKYPYIGQPTLGDILFRVATAWVVLMAGFNDGHVTSGLCLSNPCGVMSFIFTVHLVTADLSLDDSLNTAGYGPELVVDLLMEPSPPSPPVGR